MSLFDVVKGLYYKDKTKTPDNFDNQLCIVLNKWLGFDKVMVSKVKELTPYLFYIEPKHYYYLLFFTIPKNFNIPHFKKISKVENKKTKLMEKIQYVLNWSNKEMKLQKDILEKVILPNEKYWKKELAVAR